MLRAVASQFLAADLEFCLRWCRHLTRKLGKRSCVAATRPAVSTAPCWRVQLQLLSCLHTGHFNIDLWHTLSMRLA